MLSQFFLHLLNFPLLLGYRKLQKINSSRQRLLPITFLAHIVERKRNGHIIKEWTIQRQSGSRGRIPQQIPLIVLSILVVHCVVFYVLVYFCHEMKDKLKGVFALV